MTMGFVAAHLPLQVDVTATEGILSSELKLRLVDVQLQVDQILLDAHQQAQALVDEAQAQAEVLLEEARQTQADASLKAQQDASTLLEKINTEWVKIVSAIEPTAVAVARLVFERVCAGASLSDQVDAAARAAMRELPEEPVRICVSTKAREALGDVWNDVPVTEDDSLADSGVRLESKHGACDANFDLARTEVTNALDAWALRATSLLRTHKPPVAKIG
jgi:flagellar biosynthesis/type III secretory pathway protein FliH